MLKLMRWGLRVELDGGRNLKSLVAVESLASAIETVAARATATRGQTLNVSGGPPLAMREIGDILCAGIGARPWTIPMSIRLADGLARGLDRVISPVAPRRIPLSRLVRSYASNDTLSDERLRALTGYVPPVSVPDALRAVAASQLGEAATSSMSA
jgi:nucleoside-diphosphate-sugar epimerase